MGSWLADAKGKEKLAKLTASGELAGIQIVDSLLAAVDVIARQDG